MALPFVAREQWTFVGHRMHFIGRPASADTVSWDYQGMVQQVDRPADGSLPDSFSTFCPVCAKPLHYKVYSVSATRRRRMLLWLGMVLGIVIAVAAFVVPLVAEFDSDAGQAVVVVGMFPGIFLGFLSGYLAMDETGFKGHGSTWPIVAKHVVKLRKHGP